MCMQCMAGAMTAAAGAAGTRAMLAARIRATFGDRALRLLTALLLTAAVVGAGVVLG